MQLSYRGVKYTPNSPELTIVKGRAMGKYRGNLWHNHELVFPASLPAPELLKYRGVAYSTRPDLVTAPVADASTVAQPVIEKQTSLKSLSSLAVAHRDAILRNLEHRLVVAQSKGDQRLIHLLEDEMRQFA
jgi:Domain of unknown function (DUF4278)